MMDFKWARGVADTLKHQGFVGYDWINGVRVERYPNGNVSFEGVDLALEWAYCFQGGRWYEVVGGNLGVMIDPDTGKEYAPIPGQPENIITTADIAAVGDCDLSALEYDE